MLVLLCAWGWAQEEGRERMPEERVREVRPIPRSPSYVLTGKVVSAAGEPLPGAYVRVVGTVQGAVAGVDGTFRIALLSPSDPIQVEASFVGHESIRLTLPLAQADQPLTLTLRETGVQAQEVVISATRVSETVMESPVTILKMSSREIAESPGLNLFQNAAFLKSAELTSVSLTYQVINTRGFNGTNNYRFVQRMDGVEMIAPALNHAGSTLTSASDIDIERVELLPGPASALYGPNAFNGLLNIYTKDPFQYPGLSASVRLGVNHMDRIDTTPQPLYELSVRYAHTWNNRLGFKVVFNWFDAHDWVAQDSTDKGSYAGATGRYAVPGPTNPGYQAVNSYGTDARIAPQTVYSIVRSLGSAIDGGQTPIDSADYGFYLARTGYWERDLVRYNARFAKVSLGLSYRISDRLQLNYLGFGSTGVAVYQAVNRYSLRDFLFYMNKLELAGPNFRVWGYMLGNDAGRSYDARFAGLNLLNAVKPHTNWMVQYLLAYSGQLASFLQQMGERPEAYGLPQPGDHVGARAYADSDRAAALVPLMRSIGYPDVILNLFQGGARPQPGSPEFRRLLDDVTSRPGFAKGGAQLVDRSSLYHLEGQYEVTPLAPWVNLLVGGSYRYFLTNSRGTIYYDSTSPIGMWEYGAFVQAARPLWKDRIKLLGSLRYDKNVNFQGRFTPRVGFLVALDRAQRHNLRGSYQTGFRMPHLQAQFIDLDLGPFRYIGGLRASAEAYGILNNNYSQESVEAFLDSLSARTRGSNNPADYADLLRTLPMEGIKPERVSSFEVGTRHLIAERLFIDIDYAYSRFTDFLGAINFIGPKRYLQPDGRYYIGQLTPDSVARRSYASYRRYYNSPSVVYTHHLSVAVQYTLTRNFFLNANFTYAEIILSPEAKIDRLIAQFNTPKYKAGASFSGRELLASKRLSFTVAYRWLNAYLFEEPFHERIIPTYQLVDAQVSYSFPKIKSQLRIGGQNLLNNRHVEVPGGPTLGSLYYIQWTYDPFGL